MKYVKGALVEGYWQGETDVPGEEPGPHRW